MGIHEPLPWPQVGLPTLPAVSAILARYDRDQVEAFIAIAVDLLDVLDGDPEAETGTDLEDDFSLTANAISHGADVPGCPIADATDPSFTEWHTRGRQKGNPGLFMTDGRQCHEDDEDADPAECNGDADTAVDDLGCDDINDDREVEDHKCAAYGIDQTKGPLPPY